MKKTIIIVFSFIIFSIIVALTIFSQSGLINMQRMEEELEDIVEQNTELQNENKLLKQEIKALKTK